MREAATTQCCAGLLNPNGGFVYGTNSPTRQGIRGGNGQATGTTTTTLPRISMDGPRLRSAHRFQVSPRA